ncbi:MAG: hypothetical protein HFJ51_05890 [Clostridia bacterium]|nr:hypothetical protein [Clostridia bacterium]
MKLEKIAEIMIGILTQRESNEEGENSYLLFSLKNYEENLDYEEFRTKKNLENKTVKKGDLLFRLLYPNKIIYADEKLAGKIIPSQFCIIRANKNEMNPIVLKWYLESKIAENALEARVTGSVIKSMSITNLKTLEIPYIPPEKQKTMEELITLWEEEKTITKKILEEKEKLYNSYLEEITIEGARYGSK